MAGEQGFFQRLTESNFGNAVKFGSQVAGIVGLGIDIYKLFADEHGEVIDRLDAIQDQISDLERKIENLMDEQTKEILSAILELEERRVMEGVRAVREKVSEIMNARARNADFEVFQNEASLLTLAGINLLRERRDPGCEELILLQIEVALARIAFLAALPLEVRIGYQATGGISYCADLLRESTENLVQRLMSRHETSFFHRVQRSGDFEGGQEYFVRDTLSWRHIHRPAIVNDFVYRISELEKIRGDRIPRSSIENPMSSQDAQTRATESYLNGTSNEMQFIGIPSWRELANEWDDINGRIWTRTITFNGHVLDSVTNAEIH